MRTETENKHTQTSMPQVGFESTIPVFQQPETVHALDRAATVIDSHNFQCLLKQVNETNQE
jgi:hypothetical protein